MTVKDELRHMTVESHEPATGPDVSKWYMIVNPVAGGGKVKRCLDALSKHLANWDIDVQIHLTQHPGEATSLAAQALLTGYQKMIVVGGDGTLHEVVNGLMQKEASLPESFRLGVIPIGTGTDWAKMYGFPSSLPKQVEILQGGQLIRQDLGKVTFDQQGKEAVRHFVNIAGLGFDAQVVVNTQDQSKVGIKGQLVYFLGIFKTLLKYAPRSIRVVSPELSRTYESLSANVGICRFSGGGMQMVPHANPTDGLFDVTIIGAFSPMNVILNLLKLYNGRIYRHRLVDKIITDQIGFDSAQPIPIEADGESLGSTPATFSVVPKALPIIVPAAYQPPA